MTDNDSLPACISPFKKQRLQRSKHYAKGKVKRVGTAIKQKLETMEIEVGSTSSSDETAESEIVQPLKDAFHASTKKSSKIQILTILPKSWTRKTIVEKFGATDYMVRLSCLNKEEFENTNSHNFTKKLDKENNC